MNKEAIRRAARAIVQFLNANRNDGEERLDAGETSGFARALLQVISATKDFKYPSYRARDFLPVSNELDPGAETYAIHGWDLLGMAKIITNYADDLPMVDAFAREDIGKIKSLGDGYQYSIQDLRRAAFAARNAGIARLDQKRAEAAKRVAEAGLDDIAAYGDSDSGLIGMLSHPNVPLVTVLTGNWYAGAATAVQVQADLNALVNSIPVTTNDVEAPDMLVLPTRAYTYAASLPYSTLNGESVLSTWLRTNTYIRNVDRWVKCNNAGVGGTTRSVAYRRSPEVLELHIPQEFEQFPPQPVNLSWRVPCHMRTGGVAVYYPLGMAYMDGI